MDGCGPFCCLKDNRTAAPVESLSASPSEAPKIVVEKGDDSPRGPAAQELAKDKGGYPTDEKAASKESPKVFVQEAEKNVEEATDEFRISLSRERLSQSDLGLDIDSSDSKTLLILKVRDGPVKDWNTRTSKELRVRHLDRIIEVNGVSDDSTRLQDIIKAERDLLLLTIKRSKEVSCVLEKGSSGPTTKIGLDIVHSGMESLLIKRVKEGLISDWNSKNPDRPVKVGDRIVQINGKRGDSNKLLDMVAVEQKLDITFSRTSLP